MNSELVGVQAIMRAMGYERQREFWIMNYELGGVRAIVGAMGAERTSDCKSNESNGSKGSYGGYAAVVLLKTFWTAS